MLEWQILHLCPVSLNLGTCASIGFDADNLKVNSVTIGTRVLITGVITAQNTTQLYTTIPRGLLYLRDVYIIQRCLKSYVEKSINRTKWAPERVYWYSVRVRVRIRVRVRVSLRTNGGCMYVPPLFTGNERHVAHQFLDG